MPPENQPTIYSKSLDHKNRHQFLILGLILVVLIEGWIILSLLRENESRFLKDFTYQNSDMTLGDGYVSAEGSWLSEFGVSDPPSSSKISCIRDLMVCVEAKTSILKGSNVGVDANLFNISVWNEREIITEPYILNGGCLAYSLRIDRAGSRVFASQIKNASDPKCEAGAGGAVWHLGDVGS